MPAVRNDQGPRRTAGAIARLGTGVAGAAGAALVATVLLAPPATAAAPNHQGCLGADIRGYAQMGAGFGAFVSQTADGGAGQEIQAHLAGLVPDTMVPNSCND